MVNDDQVTISCHLSDKDVVYRCLAEDASDSEGESSSSPLRSYLDSSSTEESFSIQFSLPRRFIVQDRGEGKPLQIMSVDDSFRRDLGNMLAILQQIRSSMNQ
jgi:hypothetical protein